MSAMSCRTLSLASGRMIVFSALAGLFGLIRLSW
jgi:hypothetical protein